MTKPHSGECRARMDELMQRDEDTLVQQRLHADTLRRGSMTAGASGNERRDPNVEMVKSGRRTAAEDVDTRRGLKISAELPPDDGARDRA